MGLLFPIAFAAGVLLVSMASVATAEDLPSCSDGLPPAEEEEHVELYAHYWVNSEDDEAEKTGIWGEFNGLPSLQTETWRCIHIHGWETPEAEHLHPHESDTPLATPAAILG